MGGEERPALAQVRASRDDRRLDGRGPGPTPLDRRARHRSPTSALPDHGRELRRLRRGALVRIRTLRRWPRRLRGVCKFVIGPIRLRENPLPTRSPGFAPSPPKKSPRRTHDAFAAFRKASCGWRSSAATLTAGDNDVVAFTDPAGARVSFYFDATTHLLVKSEVERDHAVLGDTTAENAVRGLSQGRRPHASPRYDRSRCRRSEPHLDGRRDRLTPTRHRVRSTPQPISSPSRARRPSRN